MLLSVVELPGFSVGSKAVVVVFTLLSVAVADSVGAEASGSPASIGPISVCA